MSTDSSKSVMPPKEHTSQGFIATIPPIITGLVLYLVPPIVASIVLFIGISIFTNFTANQANDWVQGSTFAQFLYVGFTEALVILLLIKIMQWTKETWASIAVKRPQVNHLWYTLLGFGVYYLIYIVTASVVSQFVHLDFEQKQEIGFDTFVSGPSLILAFLSLVVLPPLVEEILFRGYLYTRFKRALPTVTAAVMVSLLFAAAHLQFGSGNKLLWVAALDTFILSLVLVRVREQTGTIWAGVGIHALKNFVAFLSLFIFHVQ
jgi:hypothetical protein